MKKKFIAFLILANPTYSNAETPKYFVGTKVGYQWASDNLYQTSDPNGPLMGIYGGLQFSPNWRWDLGYRYDDKLTAHSTSINVTTWLIESALQYDWFLHDHFSLYGRFGAAYWNMEKAQGNWDTVNTVGVSALGEVGIAYQPISNVRLSAGFQYVDSIGDVNTGKYDSHGFLLGLTYTFAHNREDKTDMHSELSSYTEESIALESSPKLLTHPSISRKILFEYDSSEVNDDTRELLKEVISVLERYPQSKVLIVGHTDSSGAKEYNQVLSVKRAHSVATKLINWGVAPEQVDWSGEGDTQPISSNLTTDGLAKNRRVEITIPSFELLSNDKL
ncbi:TPA: OmpA family protein [Vibrio vulnificus]|nr:OmpA family protein [Vibrio vulnificus]